MGHLLLLKISKPPTTTAIHRLFWVRLSSQTWTSRRIRHPSSATLSFKDSMAGGELLVRPKHKYSSLVTSTSKSMTSAKLKLTRIWKRISTCFFLKTRTTCMTTWAIRQMCHKQPPMGVPPSISSSSKQTCTKRNINLLDFSMVICHNSNNSPTHRATIQRSNSSTWFNSSSNSSSTNSIPLCSLIPGVSRSLLNKIIWIR